MAALPHWGRRALGEGARDENEVVSRCCARIARRGVEGAAAMTADETGRSPEARPALA